MRSLITWNPFGESFQNELSTLLGRTACVLTDDKTPPQWTPVVDIEEDEREYLITAELPEVKKENVKVTVENGVLSITGERSFEKKETSKRYHRIERSYGNFVRSFSLPEDSDSTKVHAEFKEGILKVHLPKSEQAKPREVEVKVE